MTPIQLLESLEALKKTLESSPDFVVTMINKTLPEGRDVREVLQSALHHVGRIAITEGPLPSTSDTPSNTDAI